MREKKKYGIRRRDAEGAEVRRGFFELRKGVWQMTNGSLGPLDFEYPHKDLTEKIIAAAIAVHRELGPGFVESIYENALTIELTRRGHDVQRQVLLPVYYTGEKIGEHRCDMLVDGVVILELKATERVAKVHKAQLLSTLKAARKNVGLLINFGMETLVKGVERIVHTR